MEQTKKEVITYDYRTIRVKREMELMAVDAYEALGWQSVFSSVAEGSIFSVNLSFKRDRKVPDKQNLLKLQEKVDSTLNAIETLREQKRTAGTTSSLSVGIAGALTFGGGLSMALMLGVGSVGFMAGGVALGVIGVGICLFAYPIYKKVKKNKFAKTEPLLENEFNRLADICQEANLAG